MGDLGRWWCGGSDLFRKHVQWEEKQAQDRTDQDLKVWPRKKLEEIDQFGAAER